MRFLKRWLALAVWGDGWVHRSFQVGGIAFAALLALGINVNVPPLSLALNGLGPHPVISLALPLAVVVELYLMWGFLTAGMAWAETRGPKLRICNELEFDTSPARCVRIRIKNDGEPCQPTVSLISIRDNSGVSLIDGSQLPLDLAWTHDQNQIGKQDREGHTVAVLIIGTTRSPLGAIPALHVYGAKHQPPVGPGSMVQLRGQTLHIVVSAHSPTHYHVPRIEHEFLLTVDPTAPLGVR